MKGYILKEFFILKKKRGPQSNATKYKASKALDKDEDEEMVYQAKAKGTRNYKKIIIKLKFFMKYFNMKFIIISVNKTLN